MADPEHLRLARDGKSTWNSWRLAHPSERADFSGTDFTVGDNREIILSGFEFDGDADFSDTIFGDTPIPYQTHGTGPRSSPNGAALFDGVVFRTAAHFRRAKFGRHARFDGAVFEAGADFTDAVFQDKADFSAAVFSSAGFGHACFGDNAGFDGVLFLTGAGFERAVFGNGATFEGASFERASFQSSVFGHELKFDDAVFAGLVQFNYAVFGDNAYFRGTAFEGRAFFDTAAFGDRASFETRDHKGFKDAAAERVNALPERYRKLYLKRANAGDPIAFHEISFSAARFGAGEFRRFGRESAIDTIRLWFPRLLHSANTRGMRSLDPGPGASFSGRVLRGVCDFSRVRFDQPPDFSGVEQADNLDLSGATFSLRGTAWPRWRYWTTQTASATRVRRLRKLASDIRAEDAERDLLALARMVGLGIEWSMWWADVVRPWDAHHRMVRPTAVDAARPEGWRRGLFWLRRLATCVWLALRGVGRPAVWTVLTLFYRVLSDFGRSVVLPTLWLVVSLIAFGVWYGTYTPLALSPKTAKALATFTLANSIPFAGSSRKAFEDSVAVLFSSGIPNTVHIVGLLNGLVSAVLLFLIILAVRNRFRIG